MHKDSVTNLESAQNRHSVHEQSFLWHHNFPHLKAVTAHDHRTAQLYPPGLGDAQHSAAHKRVERHGSVVPFHLGFTQVNVEATHDCSRGPTTKVFGTD